MPHIIVKLYEGRPARQKKELADKIAADVVAATGCRDTAVSVAFEEYAPGEWAEQVYRPDILDCPGELVKEPGYDPFAGTEPPSEDPSGALMEFVRGAAEAAALQDTTGYFNPMSWLDQELEETPGTFDPCFDRPWDTLSDAEKADRMVAVRQVL